MRSRDRSCDTGARGPCAENNNRVPARGAALARLRFQRYEPADPENGVGGRLRSCMAASGAGRLLQNLPLKKSSFYSQYRQELGAERVVYTRVRAPPRVPS